MHGSSAPVPQQLVTVLRRALAAERVAAGEQRIPAFRLTRHLIAGARGAGYTSARVAECMGVSVASVHTRGAEDGWVAAADFARLAGLAPGVIDQWAADGLLRRPTDSDRGGRYLASELMCVLDGSAPDSD